jgi:hypothetical protein
VHNAISAAFVHEAGSQIAYDPIFLSSVRVAWPFPDDKTKPPEPLSADEEEVYFDESISNAQAAAKFVGAVFYVHCEEPPEHVRLLATTLA